VRANYGGDPAIEIPAERNLFGSGFGMEIHEDYFGFDFLQELVGGAKRIVVRSHEDAPCRLITAYGSFPFGLIHAPAGHIRGVVCRAKDTARRTVAIALDHLKKIDDLTFVPDVIAGGDDVDIQLEEFFGERGSDSETGGRIFAVGDDESMA